MIIAIDFDGTIVEHKFPYIGNIKSGAKEVINRLASENNYIIIWTCREGKHLEEARMFLDREGFKYHKINENIDMSSFQPYPKIYADVYIDDRQLGGLPSDWEEIYNLIHIDDSIVME